jgi:ferric-dicitrate binding protein FerR (iron transport regulator)
MFGLKLGLRRRSDPDATGDETMAADKAASPNAATPSTGLSPIASAVALAAGAGVAFWWWTQWARGRAETETDIAAEPPKDAQ